MSKIMGIEISEDEEMTAEDMGLSDFIERDSETEDIMENTDTLEEKAERLDAEVRRVR